MCQGRQSVRLLMRTEDGDYLRVSAHSLQNTFSSNLSTLKQEKKLPRSCCSLISIALEKGLNDFLSLVLLSILFFPNLQGHGWAELSGFLDEPASYCRQKATWSCHSVGEAETFLPCALLVSLVPIEEHFSLHIWRKSTPL